MNGILINDKNRTKIESLIEEAQKRCRVRTIDYADIIRTINAIEDRIALIPKKHRNASFDVDLWEHKYPAVYNATPYSTQFGLAVNGGKWYLRHVARAPQASRSQGRGIHTVKMSDDMKQAIINSFNLI